MAPIEFKGGLVGDLVAALAQSGQPVVASASDNTRYGAFTLDTADLNGLSAAMKKNASLWQMPGVQYIFHPGYLPRSLVSISPVFQPQRNWWSVAGAKSFTVEKGVVTSTMKNNEALTLDDMSKFGFSKPIEWATSHAVYPITANCKDMPEKEFLTYVSKAVGGKLLVTDKTYKIQFDPMEFRKRAIKALSDFGYPKAANQPSANDRLGIDMAVYALNQASNLHLTQAFELDGGSFRLELNSSQAQYVYGLMQRSAAEQAKEAEQAMALAQQQRSSGGGRNQRGPGRPMGVNGSLLRAVQSVDSRQPFTLTMWSNFRTAVEMSVFQGPNRNSQRTQVQFGNPAASRGRGEQTIEIGVPVIRTGGG